MLSKEQIDMDPLGYNRQLANKISGLNIPDGHDKTFDMVQLAAEYARSYRQA